MTAQSVRRLLLGGAVVCFGLATVWLLLPLLGEKTPGFARWGTLGTPLMFPLGPDSTLVIANNAVFAGLMLLTQWAFLRPVRQATLVNGAPGRPRWHALLAVAFVATLVCVGLIATLLEIPRWWISSKSAWPMWAAMAGLWAAWSVVFWVYFRQGDFLEKTEVVVRALLRGSCLELFIAIPTHAWVYRRSDADCYCVRGSYTGLVFGTAALLWVFGPGIVLMMYREKQRRTPVLQRVCPRCGAVLAAAEGAAAVCPRCGHVPAVLAERPAR